MNQKIKKNFEKKKLLVEFERKIKQVFFSRLICERFQDKYKLHTQVFVQELKKVIQQKQLSTQLSKQLIAGAYFYHIGCCNLINKNEVHEDIDQHLASCFQLSAIKLERFCCYHFPKVFSQFELLELIQALEKQATPKNLKAPLEVILYKTANLTWQQFL